jgi:hypothetical protein
MADSLSTLEAQRAQTQLQISRLGDMRPGRLPALADGVATRAATATGPMIRGMVRSVA